MKQALLFFFVLLLAFAGAQAQQQVAIYYNQKWEVTRKENAAYTRLATVPDSLIRTGQLFNMLFDQGVSDYYGSGQVMARGNYSRGLKQGNWLFYFPNGQLQAQGSYKNNVPVGLWKFWRENGQALQEVVYDWPKFRFQSYWDESGTQTIVNGKGTYVTLFSGEDGQSQAQLKGDYAGGVRVGKWQYTELTNGKAGKPLIEQVYKDGEMEKGYVQQQNARVAYTSEDRFRLGTDFPYLDKVEKWTVDETAFKSNFPLLAYVLKLDVQEVQEKNEAQQQVSYYQVVHPTASGTDTLKLVVELVPDTKPEFPGGEMAMLKFLASNIRYPATAQRAGVEGFVVVTFTVQPDGSVEGIKVIKSLGYGLDQESVRVVKLMPKWKPALVNNMPVATTFTLPVRFSIVQSPSGGLLPTLGGRAY
ncbi:TonB family protein [Pontibacter ummariensis]|uniref:TonB family C-terminal domain-containing protein n=1 Tax=Pontibacter ummariensis TaxID=1610492 RepID=A0A239HD43_9BACT|nr:energy transducer TonB [Pontibacter ummariensis]PRY10640.1 TonB family protein [Pontibacter ummariensis]SNS79307.1 TonB family C-terminal domain-containing protein [Pontibacter ummariensis]